MCDLIKKAVAAGQGAGLAGGASLPGAEFFRIEACREAYERAYDKARHESKEAPDAQG